jgi:hypothetical protein
MPKTQAFSGQSVDVERLASEIQAYLIQNNFEVAFSKSSEEMTYFIQARKRNMLRTATGTRRSTDIKISGIPDDFEIRISTGEWGNNIIASAPLFVVPIIGIIATGARIYSAKKFESSLWKHIKNRVDTLQNTATYGKKTTKAANQREYDCDYIEGYPGWSSRVIGGKMTLERQEDNTSRFIFEAQDGEQITIPTSKIERAAIISRRNDQNEHDLMIEITCQGKDGDTIRPIFNISDDVITSVLAGINSAIEKRVNCTS